MLAETDDGLFPVVEGKPSCIVHAFLSFREVGQEVHAVFQGVGVAVQLGLEHFICRFRICLGLMCVLQFFPAVEPVCCLEVARLHHMEDVLHIDHLHFMEIDIDVLVKVFPDTLDFLGKHRQVELCRIESCKVAASQFPDYIIDDFCKGPASSQVLILDPVYGRCARGYPFLAVVLVVPWLDSPCPDFRLVILSCPRPDYDETEFYDCVRRDIEAGAFYVEENERPFKVQFHFSVVVLFLCRKIKSL